MRKAVSLSATISAEHGTGKLNRGYLCLMLEERMMKDVALIKKTIDVELVLNQGNKFDDIFLKPL